MNWRAYLLPGLIFQSVMIGGGYATGRELVEFFLSAGPHAGLLGLATAGVTLSVIMATAYEFARIKKTADYRTFMQALLGRGWWLFEVVYLALIILVLAVIGAAAGELVNTATGLPTWAGTWGVILLTGLLTFLGSSVISNALAGWSLLLYGVYLLLFGMTLFEFGAAVEAALEAPVVMHSDTWWLSGVRYAAYNTSIPAVLFCMTLITSRRQALGAGLMTGFIAMAPAALFYVAMLAHYPAVAEQPVPALFLMSQLHSPWLSVGFQIVVFGTFVETGTGLLHSINERIATQVHERGTALPRWARPMIAGSVLVLSIFGATTVGIVDLIAHGYGLMSWIMIAILLVPLMTVGVWHIWQGVDEGNHATC